MKVKRWNKQEEQRLEELYKTMRVPQIAKIMGRTLGSVYSKIYNMKERARTQNKIQFANEKEKKESEERAYKRLINEPVIAGVYKKDLKVKLGQSYRIERVKKSVRDWNVFTGKCIHETKDHVTIKNKTRSETFLKVDFLINEYRIKEVS